jgi:hypothetical protein
MIAKKPAQNVINAAGKDFAQGIVGARSVPAAPAGCFIMLVV